MQIAAVSPLAIMLLAGSTAVAGISQATLVAPGGFVQAGAGPSTPGSPGWPGLDWTPYHTAPGSDVHEASFSGVSTATTSASFAGGSISNSGSGTCGMGWVVLNAANSAPNSSQGPRGECNGGWKETFLITHPSHTGQTGYMQFTVHATAYLFASGFAGSAALDVTAYKDNIQLMNNALANPGNSDLLSTDRQYGHWAIATYGNPPTDSKNVNGTVTFAVPFTFGTPFSVGVYACAYGGMRSQSGVSGNSTAQAGTPALVNWTGITNIFVNNVPISGASLSSGTGLNWGGQFQPPEPEDLNQDGVVDGTDLGILLGSWGPCAGCPADINGDGTVDGTDLGLLLGAWT